MVDATNTPSTLNIHRLDNALFADKKITFATANLFNFVEPPNAFYDFENIYEHQAWREKKRWTQHQLTQLNADIVGLQEIFSIAAAQQMMEQLGYSYFATVETPTVEQDYIYSKPVVAIASKYPITQVNPVSPISEIALDYQTQIPSFSRQPVQTIIHVPEIGDIAVYVCHLKSQRATESRSPERDLPLVGRWLSSQQRGWEALMLRLFMQREYQHSPRPTVLLGDFNQAISSDITGLLTEQVEQPDSALTLEDSWQLFNLTRPNAERKVTHYHFANGNVLDYILLSQEFQPHSPYSLADVTDYLVLDKHLTNPHFELDKQASDHAFVATTVRFIL